MLIFFRIFVVIELMHLLYCCSANVCTIRKVLKIFSCWEVTASCETLDCSLTAVVVVSCKELLYICYLFL